MNNHKTYTVQVDSYGTRENGRAYVDLAAQNETQVAGAAEIVFSGQVLNDTGAAIDRAAVVIYLRDLDSGQVVGMGSYHFTEAIPGGGTGEYEVAIKIPEGFDLDRVEVALIARGEKPE